MNKMRQLFTVSFFMICGLIFLSGCGGGNKTLSKPSVNSGAPSTTYEPAKTKDAKDDIEPVKRKPVHISAKHQEDAKGAGSGELPLDSFEAHRGESADFMNVAEFFMLGDSDDSAAAVDDEIWRQLDLAEEYHSLGVMANREGSWEEAQYYFEKGLKILSQLDIEAPDDSDLDSSLAVVTPKESTPEAAKYSQILNNTVADYRVALRSLGKLEEDVSAAVLVERFGDLSSTLHDDVHLYGGETKAVTYDLPIVMNERVKNSIVYFQTVAKEAFEKYLRRSKKYTPMMTRIINEYGLPEDLVYLSLVESGYNPNAYSWARAMGLWQFISSTGRLYKLERDWWIDERKDPIKSTHAACKFLKDLYQQFGDWELAMAAYNGGPGRVSRTIKSQRTNDFWKMKLRRQTMDYVPLIMASAIIAKNPEMYGFHIDDFEPEVVWDEVNISRCLDLKAVAKELGCSLNDLKELNPELLRNYTPPNVSKYSLKIPKGSSEIFWAIYETMPSPKETSWVKHTIRRGESLSSIASKYGISQYAIEEANNMRSSRIIAGRELIVPVPLGRDYNYKPQQEAKDYASSNSIYAVRSGDTMWDIARAFGTTVSAIRETNSIGRGARIYVGQKIKIPSSASRLDGKNEITRGASPAMASNNSTDNQKETEPNSSYKVQNGDTLWDIARRFGTTTSYLRQINGMGRSSKIQPGMTLKISGSGGEFVTHKVRRGETLDLIARKYRTTTAKIMSQNNIEDADQIQIGSSLRIYTR